MVPLGCQNFTIKGGVGYEERAEIFREKKLSVKFCKKKGKLREKLIILLPGIL